MEDPDSAGKLTIEVAPDGAGVRCALAQVRGRLQVWGASEEATSSAEILLAEVLNNVLEHALAARQDGDITLAMRLGADHLAVEVVDDGSAFPDLTLPEGNEARDALDAGGLPEGGFGWGLIRMLSRDLAYRRESKRNHLSFKLPLH